MFRKIQFVLLTLCAAALLCAQDEPPAPRVVAEAAAAPAPRRTPSPTIK